MINSSGRALAIIPPTQDQTRANEIFREALRYDGLNETDKSDRKSINPKRAARLYLQAAKLGHKRAMFNYAVSCLQGRGVFRGFTKNSKARRTAVFWFQEAARKGLARAYTNLGYCQELGLGGFKANPTRAHGFYYTGWRNGDKQAKINLVRLEADQAGKSSTALVPVPT